MRVLISSLALSFLALLTLVTGVSVPTEAQAWGKTGHRVGATIADDYLSPEAQAGVEAILGVESLAEGSTWPDFMRSSQDRYWRRTAGPFHYVTVPPGQAYRDVGAPKRGDSVTALVGFAQVLSDPEAELSEKKKALRFAVHIISDLHQPLHAGNGEDRGGNQVLVTWFGDVTNLHTLWDTHLVDHQQLSFSEYAGWLSAKITPELADAWDDPDPSVWIGESVAIRPSIYPDDDDRDLRWDYNFAHKATLDERLSQSGVRIASWLNHVFEAAGG